MVITEHERGLNAQHQFELFLEKFETPQEHIAILRQFFINMMDYTEQGDCDCIYIALEKFLDSIKIKPLPLSPEQWLEKIKAEVAAHLGSAEAANIWLADTNTWVRKPGDLILEGCGEHVWNVLQDQWGPNPTYS